jgi:hypothetical protein
MAYWYLTHLLIFIQLLLSHRSVSNENYVYNFHTDEDGFIEVMAVNASNFPREAEPIGDHHHRRSLVAHNFSSIGQHDTNRSLVEDGSLVDVICFYTRKALCYEANQALTCNLNQYKYLMDNKCALAISETVSRINHCTMSNFFIQSSFKCVFLYEECGLSE